MAVYATVSQLAAWMLPKTPPANAEILLRRASRRVDRALLTSIYDPDDADVVTALMEATCEEVSVRLTQGQSSLVATGYTDVSIGSVRLSKGSAGSGGGAADDQLCGEAFTILQLAGLTGYEVQTL